MSKVRITALPDGPYLVTGPIYLADGDGNEYQLSGEKVALCRCGASSTKPLSDGTNKRIGFETPATKAA